MTKYAETNHGASGQKHTELYTVALSCSSLVAMAMITAVITKK